MLEWLVAVTTSWTGKATKRHNIIRFVQGNILVWLVWGHT